MTYEDTIAWEVRRSHVSYGKRDVMMELHFYCSTSHRGRQRPDLDNLIKSALDGCQKGGLFENDRQVTSLAAARFDGDDHPRTEIVVFGESDSD